MSVFNLMYELYNATGGKNKKKNTIHTEEDYLVHVKLFSVQLLQYNPTCNLQCVKRSKCLIVLLWHLEVLIEGSFFFLVFVDDRCLVLFLSQPCH